MVKCWKLRARANSATSVEVSVIASSVKFFDFQTRCRAAAAF
jgi:hypothetical protein